MFRCREGMTEAYKSGETRNSSTKPVQFTRIIGTSNYHVYFPSFRYRQQREDLPADILFDRNSYSNRNPLCASILSTKAKSVLTDAIASPRWWMSVSRTVPSHPEAAAR
jgi:hypothetical protein